MSILYCQRCGAQLPDESKFCTECGFRIGSTNNSSHGETAFIVPPVKEKSRNKGCLSRFLRVFLIIAAITVALIAWLIFQLDIFVYKTYSLSSNYDYTFAEKQEMADLFDGAYILLEDNSYNMFYPETGLGGELNQILKAFSSENEQYDADISRGGNYVYIEILGQNERIVFTFYKASFPERLRFISTYYGL